jgi:uncharacterized protein (TIGR03437 family)
MAKAGPTAFLPHVIRRVPCCTKLELELQCVVFMFDFIPLLHLIPPRLEVRAGSKIRGTTTLLCGLPTRMRKGKMQSVLYLLPAVVASCFGQSAPVVTGAGYILPAPINVAPGQILTIYVQGIGSALTQPVRAPGNILPTSLAGISATLQQGANRPVGILDVRPVSTCGLPSQAGAGLFPQTISNCGRLTAVTVQIPFNILTICSACVTPPSEYAPTILWVTENGIDSAVIQLMALSDQIHLLTSCDTFLTSVAPPINYTGLPCSPMVTHVDGSLVSSNSPAKAGEEIVAYAVGLGNTNPALVAGQLPTSAAATAVVFNMQFNYLSNALPTRPNGNQAPLFTGATVGYAGLYQINFVVPVPPSGTPACAAVDASQLQPGSNVVQSNLTVSIGGTFSFDGAGICVAVPQ